MASPQLSVTPEDYEKLSSVYLMLWRQFANMAGDGKWLELGYADPSELQERIRQTIETLDPKRASLLSSDYQRAQQLLLGGHAGNTPEVVAFRDYLRDHGLRFAQLADSLLPKTAEGQGARKPSRRPRAAGI
jgi:hypothetical protein